MHEAFREYVEALHPSFERLTAMAPVTIKTLPKNAPSECIYLFSEGSRHLYVGRTRHLRQRLRQHSIPASQHNQAVFAFRIAREITGRLVATYSVEGSRVALCSDVEFGAAFLKAKERFAQCMSGMLKKRTRSDNLFWRSTPRSFSKLRTTISILIEVQLYRLVLPTSDATVETSR
jgi:hypothetical protein